MTRETESQRALRVAVVGAGGWGSTLAELAARNEHHVQLWCRRNQLVHEIRTARTNAEYLGERTLSESIEVTSSLGRALDGAELIVFAVPGHHAADVLEQLEPFVDTDQLLVHGTKGLSPRGERRVVELVLALTPIRQVGVLAGPSVARDLFDGHPGGSVIATEFPHVERIVRRAVGSDLFRLYPNPDVVGVELASAMTHVVALAAGIAEGMALGPSTRALVTARGLYEASQLVARLGGEPATLLGTAGVGDIVVSGVGASTGSYRHGFALGAGESFGPDEEDADDKEGIATLHAVRALARRLRIELPLVSHVAKILSGEMTPDEALGNLLALGPLPDVVAGSRRR